MVTYIIRRLLYSVLVLIVGELSRLHVRRQGRATRSPRSHRIRTSPSRPSSASEEKHLNDSVFVRYGYWAQGRCHEQLRRRRCSTNKPILPDLWRVMKNTLQLVIIAELLAILIAVGIGVLSALRQYSVFDYTATTFSFLGLAMPLFWLALMLQVGGLRLRVDGLQHLPDRQSQRRRSRAAASTSGSTARTISRYLSWC